MKNNKPRVTIFWFRRDLRYYDNHGFFEALSRSENVLPIFIFDPLILNKLPSKKDQRVAFIFHALGSLNKQFMYEGSSIMILHQEPIKAFEDICKSYSIVEVITNHDYEPTAIARDLKVAEMLMDKGIPFKTYKDQVIFERDEVMKPDASPYTIFTPYSKVWKQQLVKQPIQTYPSEQLLRNLHKTTPFHFPSLPELGFENSDYIMPPIVIEKDIIRNYHETRNLPAVKGTSNLSVHLRFGTISIRELVSMAVELNEHWLNELIWREFFMMILYHFPYVASRSFKAKYDHIKWRNNEDDFKHWCDGTTGYPIVDAGMRELNETGLMHNRVRMIVASFLTKHLLIDWRWGEAYFAEKLLDYELSSNNSNWQWAAGCGCDAAPYFRVFNPAEQTRKFDPQLLYIKRWIKDFKPDYLPPMVDHTYARNRALQVYKDSLNQN